ncbi:unnamed protein product [Rotaria magnacalcarata]|uniref:EF-hand domain-containing protein n=1 Tax=Rotaria magnacalcarata TaxID=392030 RepID=A0A816UB86_9BILA|nr:unnamed protein product [Rotaria magnacalcarata]CAF2247588.1 unnamed protein product [Rotaria magnacalcarata]CAF3793098.1 unnamed protein product [Rotaria magnacalcarata]
MTSFLWPSSPSATVAVLVLFYCLPVNYVGLCCKLYTIAYLIFMAIGYLFSSKRSLHCSTLLANQSSYALVTGASSGIGAQICRHLVQHDFNLIMVARSERKLHALADELRQINDKINIHTVIQDLTEYNAVENLINRIDTLKNVNIDIIINNAGRGCTKPFFQTSTSDMAYEQMIALHIRVPTLLIRHYVPKMLDRPSRIVNISSEISYMSSPRAAMYASTKAFLTQLTTSLDYEIEQFNDSNSKNNVSLLLATPGPTLNTEFDHHDDSVVFHLPFVTLTAEQVASQIVDACLRGDRFCTPGWANQLTIWIMTKAPLNFTHLVCWLLWASWSEVKQWLYERRHLVIVCFNLIFFLFVLTCFLLMDKIVEYLKKQLEKPKITTTEENEFDLFTKCLTEGRETPHQDAATLNKKLHIHKDGTLGHAHHHFTKIPKFYENIPTDPLGRKLREEARALFLHRKSQEIISSDEANSLLTLLEENASAPLDPESPKINYDDFMRVVQKATPAIANLFPPTIFADLYQNDPYGRVRILDLYQYTMRKMWYHHSRMGLSLYDSIGQGYLRESDLEDYIYELIPTMHQLSQLQETFYKFYVCTAVRKFFFFLDPLRTGRIAIPDILCSGYLDKLLELREEDADPDDLEQNWFSCQSASKIYTRYLQLDKDHNGLLSRDELAKYNSSTLTPVFITRVFQECLTYGGEMDYKSYLDFVLALENRNSPQSLRYLFQIMDIDNKGYLHPGDLNFFYRGMIQMLSTRPLTDIPPFNNVQNEIFDMVKPVDSMRITLKDLINCGQGGLVLSILIDIGSFWTYENRESLIPQASTKDDSIHV